MEQLANDKVQNFLLGVTANAENFSMCEASAIDTPSEISFCGKKSVHVNFQQEPFIARLHDWLGVRENNLSEPHQLLTPEIEPGLNEEVLGLVEQMSSKVHSSIINKEEIRHHLSAPMPTSGLPLHYDYQRKFTCMVGFLQCLASKQDDCITLNSKKILQNIHQQIDTAAEIEQKNMELQQTLLNMAADSELVRQRKLAHK